MSSNKKSKPNTQGPSRDLTLAKKAYEQKDVQMSVIAHTRKQSILRADENHAKETGKYIKSIIFGGLDGIITTFAIVSGVAGAELDWKIVLVLGVANLIADGISMGFGDYVSEKAELDYQLGEAEREKWEFENCREGEIQEMVEFYESKGFSHEDATTIINLMAKNKEFFVNHMLVEELGIMPPDADENPAKNGFVTFISFIIFGSVPLLAFMLFNLLDVGLQVTFMLACIITALALFALGFVKGKLTSTPPIPSGSHVLFNGTLAALAAYCIGYALGKAVGISV